MRLKLLEYPREWIEGNAKFAYTISDNRVLCSGIVCPTSREGIKAAEEIIRVIAGAESWTIAEMKEKEYYYLVTRHNDSSKQPGEFQLCALNITFYDGTLMDIELGQPLTCPTKLRKLFQEQIG